MNKLKQSSVKTPPINGRPDVHQDCNWLKANRYFYYKAFESSVAEMDKVFPSTKEFFESLPKMNGHARK